MIDLGDRRENDAFTFGFTTYGQTGSPADATGLTVCCYKGTSETETTTGLTLTRHDDDDGSGGAQRLGLYRLRVSLSDPFYAINSDYYIVATAGTVDNVNLDGVCIATFSIANRLMLPFPGIEGAVKTDSTPSTTVVTCTGVSGGKTADFYENQALLWTSGVLKGLTFFITGSGTQATDSLSLNLQTMTAVPEDDSGSEDTFIILGTKGT